MMNKMAAQEQAAFQKQLAEYQKWAKANPAAAKALQDANNAQVGLANVPTRKKKRPTLKPSTSATAKADPKDATKAADAKSGVKKDEEEDAEETTAKPAAAKTPAATPATGSTSTKPASPK
jgi:hypothetical protein